MEAWKVLQDGLTFCRRIRAAGEVVPESDIDWRLLESLREEAPEVGDSYRNILLHVEVSEPDLADLLLSEEVEEEVEGPHLHFDVGSGEKWWVGRDGRPICAYPLGEGEICQQITSPGEKCRHHKGIN